MAINGLNIGASGLQAYQRALDVSANNVANALTKNFQPRQPQFQEAAPAAAGVVVTLSPAGNQIANAVNNANNSNNGNQASLDQASGTDLTTEIINQIQYQAGFNFSAKVVKTNDEILGTLLDLKA
jgi:flagellar basal-body rod protein FlgC